MSPPPHMLKFHLFCSTVKKLADQDLHFCHAAYVMLHGLVDMKVTCLHLLNMYSAGKFDKVFLEKCRKV